MTPLRPLRSLLLVALPMLGAVVGAVVDEHQRLGFSTWRSVCSASGLKFTTLVDFTLQLLPTAVIGLLLGGLLLLIAGATLRKRDQEPFAAAHVGCALSLPASLWLCATLPVPLMLAADLLLALAAATGLLWLMRSASRASGAHP